MPNGQPPPAPRPWWEGWGEKAKEVLPKLPWEALPAPFGAMAGLGRGTIEAGLEGRLPWQQPAGAAAPLAEFGPGYYEALGRFPPEIRERFPEAPPPTIPEEAAARREAEEALGGIGEPLGPPEFPTTSPPEGYRWEYDSASMRYVLEPLPGAIPPAEMSDWQREQIRMAEEEADREAQQRQRERAWERQRWGAQQEQQQWEQQWQQQEARTEQRRWQEEQAWREQQWGGQQAYQQQQLQWQQQQQQQQIAAQQQQQEQMIGWYREQAGTQQAEQERQERARLSAQPISWLQYASYTGEQPVVQPWMRPLMPEQYGMGGGEPGLGSMPVDMGTVGPGGIQPTGLEGMPRDWPIMGVGAGAGAVGQPIPGWTPESGAGMPQLTRPSRQYQARMGPTGFKQFLGYQQAQKGIPAEEQQWRLWSQAAPGGRQQGLRWTR